MMQDGGRMVDSVLEWTHCQNDGHCKNNGHITRMMDSMLERTVRKNY